jgi:hypothetical protein
MAIDLEIVRVALLVYTSKNSIYIQFPDPGLNAFRVVGVAPNEG